MHRSLLKTVLLTFLSIPTILFPSEASSDPQQTDTEAAIAIEQCIICHDCVYTRDASLDSVPFTLSCSHSFHTACISRWIAGRRTCPICQQPSSLDTRTETEKRTDQVGMLQEQLKRAYHLAVSSGSLPVLEQQQQCQKLEERIRASQTKYNSLRDTCIQFEQENELLKREIISIKDRSHFLETHLRQRSSQTDTLRKKLRKTETQNTSLEGQLDRSKAGHLRALQSERTAQEAYAKATTDNEKLRKAHAKIVKDNRRLRMIAIGSVSIAAASIAAITWHHRK